VVAAFRDVIPFFVNIDDPKAQGVCDQFEVRVRPTLVMADQEGKIIKRFDGERQVPNLQEAVSEFGQKYFKDYAWAESLDKAYETAKADKKNVALFFDDGTDVSKQFVKMIKDCAASAKFVFAKLPFKKNSEDAKKYKVVKPCTLILFDGEKAEELDRVEGKKPAKEFKAFLEKNTRKVD
jgi:thioredoxin-related protein